MRLRYFCHYGALTGYGRAARDYLAALHLTGDVELEIAVFGESFVSPERRYRHLDAFAVPFQDVQGDPDVEIFHAQPRVLAAVDQFAPPRVTQSPAGFARTPRIALTTWETSILPTIYARALEAFDAVIVPSDFCAEIVDCAHVDLAMIDHGVDARPKRLSYVVPHCFDETWWPKPTPRERDAGSPCRFYSIGAWGERKNMLGILRAYLHEFTKADQVQLMLLIADADYDEIRSLITRSGLPEHELPELAVPSATLSDEELAELHAAADCFVSATRGEGFGLGLFEAAIMGTNVITPLYGGQSDFLDEYPACKAIPYQMTPCFGAERRRVSDDAIAVSIAPGVDCRQMWAEPDLEALAAEMRATYEHTTHVHHGHRSTLEAKFGYKIVGPKFVNLLREIASR